MASFLKVLKDPVHDEILVDDPWIWRLVNTRGVQRLRRIKQLGTSYLTFHGAEHSRFTHSLGTYETMRRALNHLQLNYGWPSTERQRKLALAAALLHDVGHGPFSHTFESVYPIHHEQWTRKILLEEEEIRSVLTEVGSDFPQQLVDVFASGGDNTIVRQLISSQLDVDRMDYLLRDAMMTGVSYGRFELTRLLRSLALHEGQVVLKATGLHTAEQYIFARYFMYTQVYLHPVTVGSDVLVGRILQRARDILQAGGSLEMPFGLGAILAMEGNVGVADYLAIDESTLMYAFHLWTQAKDSVIRDLSRRFLNRQLFGAVVREELTSEEWGYLRTAARTRGFDPDYYIVGRTSEVAGYVYRGKGISVLDNSGQLAELGMVSRIVRWLEPNAEYRVYLPKELLEGGDPASRRIQSLLVR